MSVAQTERIWPVHCGQHLTEPAIAVCTRCRSFLCRDCRGIEPDGRAVCPSCRGERVPGTVPFEGRRGGAVERFAHTAYTALTRPAQFARSLDLKGNLADALKFGLASIALGQLGLLFWMFLLRDDETMRQLAERAQETGLSAREVQILSIGLLPVWAGIRVALYGFLLQIGSLLVRSGKSFAYRDYVRLFCYASASYLILLVAPLLVGVLLATTYVVVICGHALRHHHQLSLSQTLIATTPLIVGMLLFDFMGGL